MVSDTLKSDFSNIWTCITDEEKVIGMNMFLSFSYCG